MSGRIEKNDIISQEALKVFSEIVSEFKGLIKAASELKAGLKDSGLKQTGDSATKAKKQLSEYEKLQKKVQQQVARNTKEYAKLNKEYQKNAALQSKRNSEIRKQATGNNGLISSFRGLAKSVAGYALAYVGLTKVIQFFTSTLFNLTKKLDALHFSMSTVISDTDELAVTQSFLSKTAANYGHDLLTLTERYIKFRAASQQSNMTAMQTMSIFNAVAKAAGVLGLKTDEVNGVFLALEQMISKGKVTTEELRRQLGERLPGAMGIMADAVGVSISQLDKMLKAGEVLSEEALPKFAVALEKAYGIESVEIINTLTAAHGRLKTSWIGFVDELDASGGYKAAINNWNNMFTRFRILTGDSTKTLSKFLLLTNKAGDATRNFISGADAAIQDSDLFDEATMLNYYLKLTKSLTDSGISVKNADRIFSEYAENRKREFKLLSESNDRTKLFDFESAKKSLTLAGKNIESFSKLAKGELRDVFSSELPKDFLLTKEEATESNDAFSNYATMLKSMANTARKRTKEDKDELDTYTESIMTKEQYEKRLEAATSVSQRKKIEKLYKNQKIENEILLDNYNNRLAFEIEINNELDKLSKKKKKTGKDETLTNLKTRQELELAQLVGFQQDKVLHFTGSADELKQMEYDHDREILVQKLEDLEEQRVVIKGMSSKALGDVSLTEIERKNIITKSSNDLLDIYTEYEKLKTEITNNAIDYRKEIDKKDNKDKLKAERDALNERLSLIDYEVNKKNLKVHQSATEELQVSRKTQSKKKAINLKATTKELSNIYNGEQEKLKLFKEGSEGYNDIKTKMADLEIILNEKVRDGIIDLEQTKRDEVDKTMRFIGDSVNKGFEVQQMFAENAMMSAENRYKRDIQLAGDSEAAKLVALNKFEEEKRKIEKRNAIAAKSQAAFNIALGTAQAIIGIWRDFPKVDFGITAGIMSGVVGALGAAQLTAVLAKPLPQFAEGVENFSGGLAIVGDKKGDPTKAGGSEMLVLPGGKKALSPSTPTVMNLPSGTDVIPHDETTRMLANRAMSSTSSYIDMSSTDRHLISIDKNTSESVTYINGVKMVKKKNFTGRYR